jgi:hypothetical protein
VAAVHCLAQRSLRVRQSPVTATQLSQSPAVWIHHPGIATGLRYGYRNDYCYFHNGLWYRPFGGYYTIARPPRGIVIYTLPPYYTSLWFGGVRYYYADDVYYRWDAGNRGYVVSDPPVEGEPADRLYVLSDRGQSTEQQAKDRYECYRWGADQTGFDPTQPEVARVRRYR